MMDSARMSNFISLMESMEALSTKLLEKFLEISIVMSLEVEDKLKMSDL